MNGNGEERQETKKAWTKEAECNEYRFEAEAKSGREGTPLRAS